MNTVRTVILNALPPRPWRAKDSGEAFAPSNIALIKYWGKRDAQFNLPVTSSLSISLGERGSHCKIREQTAPQDTVLLNGQPIPEHTAFTQKLVNFLDLIRPTPNTRYHIDTQLNLPVAAGLASSACGFAALVLALNDLYHWEAPRSALSQLARIGSGSAARSLWHGFVEWTAGEDPQGQDSHGHPIATTWPNLRIGLWILHDAPKIISSREAMTHTTTTSPFYKAWPDQVATDLAHIKQAIETHDFEALGEISEHNALMMHACMQAARPAIVYHQPETITAMQTVWRLRKEGLPVYFTQDAGPNLKLLMREEDVSTVIEHIPTLELVMPFSTPTSKGADHE